MSFSHTGVDALIYIQYLLLSVISNNPSNHVNTPLVNELAVVLPHEESPGIGLELGEDDGQSLIPHVLEATQDASTEEHLAVTETVLAGL